MRNACELTNIADAVIAEERARYITRMQTWVEENIVPHMEDRAERGYHFATATIPKSQFMIRDVCEYIESFNYRVVQNSESHIEIWWDAKKTANKETA